MVFNIKPKARQNITQSVAIHKAEFAFKFIDCHARKSSLAMTAKKPLCLRVSFKAKATLSVFKLPFDKDGASAPDEIAVFVYACASVSVVVVVVKGVKDIFHTHSNHAHIFVKAYTQTQIADEIRVELFLHFAYLAACILSRYHFLLAIE